MVKTITQKVIFKNTKPAKLYDLYMDSDKHTAATGSPANIHRKPGQSFMAYDNYITGKNLQLIPDRLIVQTWRASDWENSDIDSTFILSFQKKGKDTILYMTHANVPKRQVDDLKQGWVDFYWKPWKNYLNRI